MPLVMELYATWVLEITNVLGTWSELAVLGTTAELETIAGEVAIEPETTFAMLAMPRMVKMWGVCMFVIGRWRGFSEVG